MRTIILYATKYGAAGEIARRIADRIKGSVVCDLKRSSIPGLADFDCVIFGSSLYVGAIRKEAKAFLAQEHNAAVLREKKLGLFLSGMEEGAEKKFFEANFPAEILQAAKAVRFLGGVFDPRKAGIVERFMVKIATKRSGYISTIDDGRIEQFVQAMKT